MSGTKEENIKAYWSYSIVCNCPKCNENIDLVNDDNYEDPVTEEDKVLELCEQGTERTTDYKVVCNQCKHEFMVDFIY